jgi:hypothetical protein
MSPKKTLKPSAKADANDLTSASEYSTHTRSFLRRAEVALMPELNDSDRMMNEQKDSAKAQKRSVATRKGAETRKQKKLALILRSFSTNDENLRANISTVANRLEEESLMSSSILQPLSSLALPAIND